MRKMSTGVAAIVAAGIAGLACSNSGLKSRAGDAGAANGGHAGSTISSGTTDGSGGAGGAGGTAGAVGSGGISGTDASVHGGAGALDASSSAGGSGTGGQPGSLPICASIRMCDPPDQQIDGPCPADRECYSFQQYCFVATTVCMLPAGVHCSDLVCDPGDSPTTSYADDCRQNPNACYSRQLCAYDIWCRYGTDAGVVVGTPDASVVPGPRIPRCGDGILQTNSGEKCDDSNTFNGDGCNALCQIEAGWQCPTPGQACIPCGSGTIDGCDAGSVGYCGDGIVQTNLGEECDLGLQNGVFLEGLGECRYCQWIPWLP